MPDGLVIGIDSAPSIIAAASRPAQANLEFEQAHPLDATPEVPVTESPLLHEMEERERERRRVLNEAGAVSQYMGPPSLSPSFKDHHNLLRRILRALKPGGFARLNFPGDGNCATFNRTVQQIIAQPRYAPGFRAFEWPWFRK